MITSSASGRSPVSAASSTSSGRNRLPPASIRWLAASVTNGARLRDVPGQGLLDHGHPVAEPAGEGLVGHRHRQADGARRDGSVT